MDEARVNPQSPYRSVRQSYWHLHSSGIGTSNKVAAVVEETLEHRRFAEFCAACAQCTRKTTTVASSVRRVREYSSIEAKIA
jgi:hypothetical protein